MKEPLNVDVAIHFICISLSDVLKIYIPWKQRNSLKLIPSRREKVLFICTEWADISKRNYMNRLFLVCLRPVQSPEVIMQQSPVWRPEQWQCYCYTELFMEASALKMEGCFISIDENIFPIDWILFLSAVPVVSHSIPNTKLLYPSMINPWKCWRCNDSWVFNCQFIENIFLLAITHLNKVYFFCFTDFDFAFSWL